MVKLKMTDGSGDVVDAPDDKALAMVNSGVAVPADPDAVVEQPSKLVAEADARHKFAETEYATAQEKRQAAVEMADVSDRRPQGSHAQIHEATLPVVAVPDKEHAKAMDEAAEEEPATVAKAPEKSAGKPTGAPVSKDTP